MSKVNKNDDSIGSNMLPPAMTEEERENQMISLATSLAEKQLMDGTASSAVICHYLKLGSTRDKERAELEKLREETKLVKEKTKSIKESANAEKLYSDAIKAFGIYSGGPIIDNE